MTALILSILFFLQGGGDLQPRIGEYLAAQLKQYERVEFEVVSVPQLLERKELDYSFDHSKQFRVSGSYGYIPVTLQGGGLSDTRTTITVKLKLYQKVLLPLQDIAAGETLSPGLFEYKTREVTSLRGEPFTGLYEVSGKQSAMRIRKGAVLLRDMLELAPDIHIGERVQGYIANGSVVISLDVKAREDGRTGDIINVITDDKKVFKAKVESPERVQLLE